MNCRIKYFIQFLLIGILFILSVAPGFAAEVRRVPSKALVEQGILALTLDAEGAEDFRYIGLEDKTHVYRGTILPESKLKFSIRATLGDQKSLPITGRSCIMRMQVVAKKDGKVIKTQNYSKENKSNVFVNYTVPQGADTLEVSETFVLNNKSKEQKFNQRVTSQNKLILTTSTAHSRVAANAANKVAGSGDKKEGAGRDKDPDKKEIAKTDGAGKTGGTDNNKTDAKESKGTGKGMLAGVVAAVAAIVGGGFYFMKKRKEEQAANEEIARKEKLRQQAIQRQQELQRGQEKQGVIQEQRGSEQLQATQQYEAGQQNAMEEQNASQQSDSKVAAAGAAGVVMGYDQINAAENAQQQSDTAPRFCENCGAPLKPDSKFCENCGAKL